jgi:hypothetical protein
VKTPSISTTAVDLHHRWTIRDHRECPGVRSIAELHAVVSGESRLQTTIEVQEREVGLSCCTFHDVCAGRQPDCFPVCHWPELSVDKRATSPRNSDAV